MPTGFSRTFPSRRLFDDFLDLYANRTTYWYVPKARALSPEFLPAAITFLSEVYNHYLERTWDQGTQDELLDRLIQRGVLSPYNEPQAARQSDRTALIRIFKTLLEFLGLLWTTAQSIIVTNAGLDLMTSSDPASVIARQIAKYQYPNPALDVAYGGDFRGLLPHLFLLQLLSVTDGFVSREEFELSSTSHSRMTALTPWLGSSSPGAD